MFVHSFLAAEATGNPKLEPQCAERRERQKAESLSSQQYLERIRYASTTFRVHLGQEVHHENKWKINNIIARIVSVFKD